MGGEALTVYPESHWAQPWESQALCMADALHFSK